MLIQDLSQWREVAASTPAVDPACARAVFLVSPDGFSLAAESASDNDYMALNSPVDVQRALAQHRELQRALAEHIPTISFPGSPRTPDAVFPNNVFATARNAEGGRFLIGNMRHPVRQREAEREDIPQFFTRVLGYQQVDLRVQPGLTELTGTLIIDRARGLGYGGLSPRCDVDGLRSMSAAFGLRASLAFALQPGEYHTNVMMSVLASRALVICPSACVEPAAVDAIAALYAPQVIELDAAEKLAFAGNCIALSDDTVWMSECAADGLRGASRLALQRAGFAIRAVALDEIERAGGSLRCCVAEIY